MFFVNRVAQGKETCVINYEPSELSMKVVSIYQHEQLEARQVE